MPGFYFGGIESRMIDWYENMDREKFSFSIITQVPVKNNKFAEKIQELGGVFYQIPKFSIKTFPRYLLCLNNIFKNGKFDIAHSHSLSTGFFFLLYAKNNGIKNRILHSRTTSYDDTKFSQIHEILKKYAVRNATHYFACSEKAWEWAFADEVDCNEVKIINNGIQLNKFQYDEKVRQEIRNSMNIKDEYLIGSIGRMSYPKNYEFLIEVFKNIHKSDRKTKLGIVGEGPSETILKKMARNFGLDNSVILPGKTESPEKYYMAFDVFVSPSRFEGFGTTAIEAQATGLPCVLSDGFPESTVITENVARLSLSDGVERWKKEILAYKEKKRTAGDLGRIKSMGYDVKDVVRKLEIIYYNQAKKKSDKSE